MYTAFKVWDEVVEYLKSVDAPQCFMVNYLPNEDEYDLWIGNQPYENYEKTIEKITKESRSIRRSLSRMEDNKSFLEMAKEIYQDDKESEILCLDIDDALIGLNMAQIEQVIEVLSSMSEYIKSE